MASTTTGHHHTLNRVLNGVETIIHSKFIDFVIRNVLKMVGSIYFGNFDGLGLKF